MPTLEQARQLILEHTHVLGTETVEIIDALGLVAAEDIEVAYDMPLCDNSAMDGFAVRSADCSPGVSLRITGFISAGHVSTVSVDPGCAVKVMTGARIPPGGDAVVPFEDTEGREDSVTVKAKVREHQHIRLAGGDVRRGEVIIAAGTVIRAPEISILASFGMQRVTVLRRPRVAILSTGDELVAVGEVVSPGKVVDSNGVTLAALVKACGALVAPLGIAKDTRASHVAKMTIGLQADMLITSAGVSVGDCDLVRDVLAELGTSQVFSSIEARPGGPTTFGVKDGTLVFSLPGNPVASMIIFEQLVKPAILKAMGYRRILPPLLRAVLQEDVFKRPGRIKFLRVRLESNGDKLHAFSSGDQTTGMLKTLIRADGIAVLAAEHGPFSAGDEVDVQLISSNLAMREP